MSYSVQKVIMRAKLEGIINDLMVKTTTDNVYLDDSTTLSAKLAEMISAINLRAKSTDVTTQINNAISALIGGAPDTYDTLKEIADYIADHEDVVTAINSAIGAKADKATFDAVKAKVDSLGTLATKSVVTETELSDSLKTKINTSNSSSHSHSNKGVLDGITQALVTEWNSKGTIFVSSTEPTGLAAGDLWIQPVE